MQTDLGLPDGNGLTFIPPLKNAAIQSLAITAFGDRETVVAALSAGAGGYLLKDASFETILDGIRETLNGGRRPVAERLTNQETHFPQLFAKGHNYKSAVRELGISPLKVGGHVKAICRKLEINSRGDAFFAAIQRGQLKI